MESLFKKKVSRKTFLRTLVMALGSVLLFSPLSLFHKKIEPRSKRDYGTGVYGL